LIAFTGNKKDIKDLCVLAEREKKTKFGARGDGRVCVLLALPLAAPKGPKVSTALLLKYYTHDIKIISAVSRVTNNVGQY